MIDDHVVFTSQHAMRCTYLLGTERAVDVACMGF